MSKIASMSAPNVVQRNDFIQAMRGVASSVTVVTTDGISGRHGTTVSAFCSVSADPPTVLVCLHGNSRIADSVIANGAFCVNVLPVDNQWVAERFAGRHDQEVGDRFDNIECELGTTLPVIAGSTAFTCSLSQTVQSGSHLVCRGEVQDLRLGNHDPLAWLDGDFHQVVSCQHSVPTWQPPQPNDVCGTRYSVAV